MKIRDDISQGSLEWLAARAGVATASEFDSLVTPEFKLRTGDTPKNYVAQKLAEAWLGSPIAGHCTIDMDAGRILEEEARPYAALVLGVDITQVGFITTDDGRVGCSPDGLIGDDGGIEIKCPRPDTHTKYLLNGGVPKNYMAQVHGSIYVSERKWWKFISYCRGMPPLIVHVDRDPAIMERIDDALAVFRAEFDVGMEKLVELNGGPPKRRTFTPSTPEPAREQVLYDTP
jgi:hypothetical protein